MLLEFPMKFLFGSCKPNMFSVRSLWTGLYLAVFLGCLMSVYNRNKSSGGPEEDLVQYKDFWILFVKEAFVFGLEMFFECWPRLHTLSEDQAWTQGPSTCTGDCLGLGPHRVFPEKNNNSFLTDFILQQGMIFSQPAARRCSLSVKRPLYGSPHCHVDPNTFLSMISQSHQRFCSKADESATCVARQLHVQ